MSELTIMMTGDGYYAEASKIPDGANAYALIDDPVGSHDGDATYIFNGSDSIAQQNSFVFDDISISGSISSLTIYMMCIDSRPITPFVRIAGANYYGTEFTPSEVNYELLSYTFALNPATGVAWTQVAINSCEIGVKLGIKYVKKVVKVTQLYAKATYTSSTDDLSGASLLL